MVAGFFGSSEPYQPAVREVERFRGSAHIEDFAFGIYQESNPARLGDLL